MRKKLFYISSLLLILFASIELFSYAGLFFLKHIKHIEYAPISVHITAAEQKFFQSIMSDDIDTLNIHDPDLGWTVKKSTTADYAGNRYTINSQGVRAVREYASAPADGKIRVAAFGCSFVFCYDVSDHQTWPYYIERMAPNLEVLNYGTGSYGIDQAYLRYMREGSSLHPDIVLVGVSPDTVRRNVNIYRTWLAESAQVGYSGWWFKPRYQIRNGALDLIPNPCQEISDYRKVFDPSFMARIGQHDLYFKHKGYTSGKADGLAAVRLIKVLSHNYSRKLSPGKDIGLAMFDRQYYQTHKALIYDPDFEGYQILERLCDRFDRDIRANGAVPVFVMLPERGDLRQFQRTGVTRLLPLIRHFDRQGYTYIDLTEYFPELLERYSLDAVCPSHYSPVGNAFVAAVIKRFLERENIIPAT